MEWDSGMAGAGAERESVYEWRGMFAVSSLDYCDPEPFSTLNEALKANDLLMVTSATTSISCSRLSAKDLAKRLDCDE